MKYPSIAVSQFVKGTYANNVVKSIGNRQKTVGGSEIHKMRTPAGMKSVVSSKLGLSKLGLKPRLDNILPILHGNIYESVTKNIAEIVFDCKILEPNGGYSHKRYPFNSYSADGIGTMMISDELMRWCYDECLDYIPSKKRYVDYKYITKEQIAGKREVDVLFEFKSPFTRELDGLVSDDYCYQILAGLDIIRLCNIGAFVQCNIKEYSGENHFSNEYNTPYHEERQSQYQPTHIGKKYYIQLGENDFKYIDALGDFRLDCAFSDYGVYGKSYTSVDSPCFSLEEGVISFHEFNFIEVMSRYVDTSLFSELIGGICQPITEEMVGDFYAELDKIMFEQTPAFSQNYWKLIDIDLHLFPVKLGFVGHFADNSRQVIEAVDNYH